MLVETGKQNVINVPAPYNCDHKFGLVTLDPRPLTASIETLVQITFCHVTCTVAIGRALFYHVTKTGQNHWFFRTKKVPTFSLVDCASELVRNRVRNKVSSLRDSTLLLTLLLDIIYSFTNPPKLSLLNKTLYSCVYC